MIVEWNTHIFSPERMVWGAGSPEIVDAHMEGYPESDRRKVKGENLARLLGFAESAGE